MDDSERVSDTVNPSILAVVYTDDTYTSTEREDISKKCTLEPIQAVVGIECVGITKEGIPDGRLGDSPIRP